MEYKTVILSVFIMSFVLVQIQVEADWCCPTQKARNTLRACLAAKKPATYCASRSGCRSNWVTCPPGYTNDVLENPGDALNEYCKLGCASSVCGALTTLQNSDANEIVTGAVEQCTQACSTFCSKVSHTTVETA